MALSHQSSARTAELNGDIHVVSPMTASNTIFAFARARQALRDAGLPETGKMVSASSTRNEVVICGDYVVRTNREPNQRLLREAAICRVLPPRPWTPRVLAHGGEIGADFLIVARRPGQPLSRAWPGMTKTLRKRAILQLAAALNDLHATSTPRSIPDLTRSTHLLDPNCLNPLMPILMQVEQLRRNRYFDQSLLNDVDHLIHEIGDALADYSQARMIHGDLSFENVLWDGDQITALLDFEWSRGAPPGLDLDVLFRYCALPFVHVPEQFASEQRAEDYRSVPNWLAEAMPELFETPRLADRMKLFALAFDMNELAEEPPTKRRHELGPLHPMNRLANLLTGGGRLETALTRTGLTS